MTFSWKKGRMDFEDENTTGSREPEVRLIRRQVFREISPRVDAYLRIVAVV